MMTTTWLGDRIAPIAFELDPLCAVGFSCVTTAFPSIFTVGTPSLTARGPIFTPDTTPPAPPASSPELIGTLDETVITGRLANFTFIDVPSAWVSMAMLGNGVGMGG